MSKRFEIEELFMLEKLFTNKYFPEKAKVQVGEFFKKKKHRSKAKDFKPGSPNHAEELTKDKIIADIPEHPVTFKEYSNEDSYELISDSNISLQRGYITIKSSTYNYDTEEYEERETKWYFFKASNSRTFSSESLIFDFMQLFTIDDVIIKLMGGQKDADYCMWRDWFNSKEELKPYLLVVHKITKPQLQKSDVKVYDDKIEIGGDTWTHKYLSAVAKAEKDNDYEFYDYNDKIITFNSDYNHKYFLEFWEAHTEKVQLTKTNKDVL